MLVDGAYRRPFLSLIVGCRVLSFVASNTCIASNDVVFNGTGESDRGRGRHTDRQKDRQRVVSAEHPKLIPLDNVKGTLLPVFPRGKGVISGVHGGFPTPRRPRLQPWLEASKKAAKPQRAHMNKKREEQAKIERGGGGGREWKVERHPSQTRCRTRVPRPSQTKSFLRSGVHAIEPHLKLNGTKEITVLQSTECVCAVSTPSI